MHARRHRTVPAAVTSADTKVGRVAGRPRSMSKRGSMMSEASNTSEAGAALATKSMSFAELKDLMAMYKPKHWAKIDELFHQFCSLASMQNRAEEEKAMDVAEWTNLMKVLNIVPDYLGQVRVSIFVASAQRYNDVALLLGCSMMWVAHGVHAIFRSHSRPGPGSVQTDVVRIFEETFENKATPVAKGTKQLDLQDFRLAIAATANQVLSWLWARGPMLSAERESDSSIMSPGWF